jgi:hypothetical protein
MKIKNKPKKTLFFLKNILGIIAVCWLLYTLFENAITNYRLEKNGIYTKAIVYEKKNVGAQGTISTRYYFNYKNNKYYGASEWDDKVVIGDSIIVFFLESDPNINRSNSLLEIPIKKSN